MKQNTPRLMFITSLQVYIYKKNMTLIINKSQDICCSTTLQATKGNNIFTVVPKSETEQKGFKELLASQS
jgi:hypothetical protein